MIVRTGKRECNIRKCTRYNASNAEDSQISAECIPQNSSLVWNFLSSHTHLNAHNLRLKLICHLKGEKACTNGTDFAAYNVLITEE